MKFRNLAVFVMLIFALMSCGNKETVEVELDKVENVENQVEEFTEKILIDREGKEVLIPVEVNTIISLAPSITETLIDLGLGDKIIATDTYSAEEEGLSSDIKVFDILSPDIETIASLKPDIIFVSGMSKVGGDDPFLVAKELGITVTYIPTANSLEDIRKDILFLGEATRCEARAIEIVEEFDSKINEIKEKLSTIAEQEKTVYFEISPAPYLYSFGQGVFLNEILELLSTENIFAEQEGWVSVTEEEIFARNPDVIFTNTYIEGADTELISRNGWDVLDAVKNNNVYTVDKSTSSQANEFVVLAIEEMAKALYPTLFN